MNCCQFQWRPKSISFFLAIAIALSIYSSVDCRLVSVGKNSRWNLQRLFYSCRRVLIYLCVPSCWDIFQTLINLFGQLFSDLGFNTKHYNTSTIEIGLWSFESPDGSSCVRHVNDDNSREGYLWITDWSKRFINDDFSWTTSRIFAVTGMAFGSISLVSVSVSRILLFVCIFVKSTYW